MTGERHQAAQLRAAGSRTASGAGAASPPRVWVPRVCEREGNGAIGVLFSAEGVE